MVTINCQFLALGITTAESCEPKVEATVICSPVEGDQDYLQVRENTCGILLYYLSLFNFVGILLVGRYNVM